MCLKRSRHRLKLCMTSTARHVVTVSDTEGKDRHQPDVDDTRHILGLAGIASGGLGHEWCVLWGNVKRS